MALESQRQSKYVFLRVRDEGAGQRILSVPWKFLELLQETAVVAFSTEYAAVGR